jgi:cytochrome c-type biogenesis protein
MIQEVTLIGAFFAGLVTFLAPCTFATLPIFVTYIVGSTAEELHEGGRKAKLSAALNAISYILGFTVVFVLLGMTATSLGKYFSRRTDQFTKLGGVFVVLFGLFMIIGEKIPIFQFLYKEKKLDASGSFKKFSYLRSFLIGVTSAFAWTPCIGPILGAILFYASATTSVMLEGGLLLFAYSLGISVPFFVLSLFIGYSAGFIKKINKYVGLIHKVSGVLMILLGIFLVSGFSDSIFAVLFRFFVSLGYTPV